jgi:hypothetical protein
MNFYVSFDGDHIGNLVGRSRLADDTVGVKRISQAIEQGNKIFEAWALSHSGEVISLGGDEGSILISGEYLGEIPKLREQYKDIAGSTVSIGVGVKLSEADKSLIFSKLHGGDKITLYTKKVEDAITNLKEKPSEGEKLKEAYLDVRKAEEPKKDYESLFHEAVNKKKEPEENPGISDETKAKVVQVLQSVKAHGPELEQLKQSNPELYQSVVSLVQAMITMAKGPEPVRKSEECEHETDEKEQKCSKCGVEIEDLEKGLAVGRHIVRLPVGSQIDPGPSSGSNAGKIKIKKPDGKVVWRSVRSGLKMAPDGTPISSRSQTQ